MSLKSISNKEDDHNANKNLKKKDSPENEQNRRSFAGFERLSKRFSKRLSAVFQDTSKGEDEIPPKDKKHEKRTSSEILLADVMLSIQPMPEPDTNFTRTSSFRLPTVFNEDVALLKRTKSLFYRNRNNKSNNINNNYNYQPYVISIDNYDCSICKKDSETEGGFALYFQLDNICMIQEETRCRSFQITIKKKADEPRKGFLKRLFSSRDKTKDLYYKIVVSEESIDIFRDVLSMGRQDVMGLESSPLFRRSTRRSRIKRVPKPSIYSSVDRPSTSKNKSSDISLANETKTETKSQIVVTPEMKILFKNEPDSLNDTLDDDVFINEQEEDTKL